MKHMGAKHTVFIIDDDKFLLDMYALKFVQMGWNVETALGSADGIEKLRGGFAPTVILTDILMPSMDGFELLERIRDESLARGARIVILSNKGEKEDIVRGIALGADGYIVKASAIPSEVVAQVEKILGNKKQGIV
ncbi:MAG: response regulator [Patescibacteria group bacterium]